MEEAEQVIDAIEAMSRLLGEKCCSHTFQPCLFACAFRYSTPCQRGQLLRVVQSDVLEIAKGREVTCKVELYQSAYSSSVRTVFIDGLDPEELLTSLQGADPEWCPESFLTQLAEVVEWVRG